MGDYQNIINTAVEEATRIATEQGLKNGMEKGLKLGMEKGREEGELAKAREIAGKLMATGMTKAEAAAFVGISEEKLDTGQEE